MNHIRFSHANAAEKEMGKKYISGAGYIGNFSDPFASQPHDGFEYATILGTLVAPTSRGNVSIISADTRDLPIINPNWLATETDQQVAVAIYKRTREAFGSAAMAPVVIGNEYFPGDQIQTDAEILDVIRQTLMTIYHASCTCKMGTDQDRMAVVDSRARVFGVQQLRVVDASIFPVLPPGHPQSVVCRLSRINGMILQANWTSQTCLPRRLPLISSPRVTEPLCLRMSRRVGD